MEKLIRLSVFDFNIVVLRIVHKEKHRLENLAVLHLCRMAP